MTRLCARVLAGLVLLSCSWSGALLAADLTVGPGMQYDSIEAAYADAQDGDTILVHPLGGGAAYQQVAL